MYITWLGHSCFRLESAGYGLVIDPYRVVAGYPPLRVEANAVYISHHHFDHDCLEAVTLRRRSWCVGCTPDWCCPCISGEGSRASRS